MAVFTALFGFATGMLLRRMRSQLLESGRLSRPTVSWMYATYGAHAGITALALRRRRGTFPPPPAVLRCGRILALAGTGMLLASTGRFTGIGQLSGTDPGVQITDGVYRFSRNPQYTGYLLVLAGLALTRRSTTAAILTGVLAAAYRWWVPVEEAHLESEFGRAYRSYRDRTPRWLGVRRGYAPTGVGRRCWWNARIPGDAA